MKRIAIGRPLICGKTAGCTPSAFTDTTLIGAGASSTVTGSSAPVFWLAIWIVRCWWMRSTCT